MKIIQSFLKKSQIVNTEEDARSVFSFNTKSIGDILSIPNTFIKLWGDENNTFLQYRNIFYSPLVIKGENEDVLRLIISDDFSSFSRFRSSIGGYSEDRSKTARWIKESNGE